MASGTQGYEAAQQGIIEKLQSDVEKLKDKQREFANGEHQ